MWPPPPPNGLIPWMFRMWLRPWSSGNLANATSFWTCDFSIIPNIILHSGECVQVGRMFQVWDVKWMSCDITAKILLSQCCSGFINVLRNMQVILNYAHRLLWRTPYLWLNVFYLYFKCICKWNIRRTQTASWDFGIYCYSDALHIIIACLLK